LITPHRPMTMESVAGKNPITHVGKLYNVAARQIAAQVLRDVPGLTGVECYLVSRIGRPVREPQIVQLRLAGEGARSADALRPALDRIVTEGLAALDGLWRQLLAREITLYCTRRRLDPPRCLPHHDPMAVSRTSWVGMGAALLIAGVLAAAAKAQQVIGSCRLESNVACTNQDLSGASLAGVNLEGGDLRGTSFAKAILQGANLLHADLRTADLSGTDLSGANLSQANLNTANFQGANASRADFRHANLSGANLSDAKLSRADVTGAIAIGAVFKRATMEQTILVTANLSGADLTNVNLASADLQRANLSRVDFEGAHLRRANLTGASLVGANLAGADLTGAVVDGVDLHEAKLNRAIWTDGRRCAPGSVGECR